MQRLFPVRSLAGVLAGVMIVVWPALAAAQTTSQEVKFETVDKAELKGTFYPGQGINKPPCVLLLHKLGGNRTQEGWDDLAKKLQKQGYAVLSFDFRGHNDSTTVDPEVFWSQSQNIRTFKVGKDNRDKITAADYLNPKKNNAHYVPILVNDIEAAKDFLNRKNNSTDCNTSNIIVIGADESAALGSLWVWSQFQKPRWIPNPLTGGYMLDQRRRDGDDIAACVWLTMPASLNKQPVRAWLASPGAPIPEKVSMAFFYGERDVQAGKTAAAIVASMKGGRKMLDTTKVRPVKGTKAAGNELLKSSLNTSDEICAFLKTVLEKRGNVAWEKRVEIPLKAVSLSPFFNLQ